MRPNTVIPLHTDDLELWRLLRAGNYQAFTLLYQRHAKALLTYGCRLTADEDLVKDCIQDFFVELWNRRFHIPGDIQSVKFYFLGALKHKVLRATTHQSKQESWQEAIENISSELSTETLLIEAEHEAERIARLRHAIAQLAPRQQEVIHLRYFHNLSHTETAELMNLQSQSVRNLLHVALNSLRKQLEYYAQSIILFLTGYYF